MARGRLYFIVGFIIHLLQNSVHGRQCDLPNNINLELINNLAATDSSIAGLISNAVSNQNYGNIGFSANAQDKHALNGLQQFLNLQQQHAPLNLPLLPICGTVQPGVIRKDAQQQSISIQPQLSVQPTSKVIPQQSLDLQPISSQQSAQNLQQCLNSQQMQTQIPQQMIDLQQLQNIQQVQNLQQPLHQHPVLQQQSSHSIPPNLQIIGQQAPVQSEIPLSYLSIVNGQTDCPASQGILLQKLGSNLPSSLSNNCPKAPEQVFIPQNNVASLSNVPISVYDGTQTVNSVPISIAASSSPADCIRKNPQKMSLLSISPSDPPRECIQNNPSQLKSVIFPMNVQNQATPAYNEPCAIEFNPQNNVQFQSMPYQAIPKQVVQLDQIQTQPIQTQPIQLPVQPAPIQPVQSQPIQEQPKTVVQCTASQPVEPQCTNSVQIQPTQNPSQYPPSSLESLLMSQFQSSNSAQQYPNNQPSYPSSPNYGSKSSSMKALLPLLFNLLQEKNMMYPPNYNNNYGCMNGPDCPNWNPPGMNNNYYNNPVPEYPIMNTFENHQNNVPLPEPQIIQVHSKPSKHRQSKVKEVTNNSIESEENDNFPKRGKQKKYNKKIKNESIEYEDDYGDSYENDD